MITDTVALAAQSQPDGVAWRNLDDGSELSLALWDGDANRMARGLHAHGVTPGDRIVIEIRPDDPFPWLVTYVGVHRAGAIAVPVNTRLAAAELRTIVRHADAAMVVEADGSMPDGSSSDGRGRADWRVLLDDDSSPLSPGATGSDALDLLYTSGTTGTPKAVLATSTTSTNPTTSAPTTGPPANWNGLGFMTCSPFATTSGILLVDAPLRNGMSGWYLPRFDAGRWLELVEQDRPIAAFLVPAMAQLLVAHPRFVDADLSSLAVLTFGGAPMARATLRRLSDRMPGADVLVGYGLTEFGAVSRTPSGDRGGHLGSVGRPLDGVEVRVVGQDGAEASAGQVGEITVRGSSPPRSYYKDADASGLTWQGGWLHTGDLGYLDSDGFIWVTGRAKDVIIRGGLNIVPRDVEEVLLSHPDIVDAVVVGVAHDVLGEDVATWVVLREGSVVTTDDLRSFMLEQLADYKVPRTVHLVDELPRNASGKVVKDELPGRIPPS